MTTTTDGAQAAPITFPGQAAAPAGPVELLPMYLMHHAFRRDLSAFTAAAASTPVEQRAPWRLLEQRWSQFARVLHHHHSGEDTVLWPLLLARVDAVRDRDGRATLEAMEAEHSEIDPLLDGCAAGLARLAEQADEDARAALVVRLNATRERLGHHLGHEERDAMALVQAHLTPAEWDAMDEDFARDYTRQDQLFALPWVLHDVPEHLLPRVLQFIGTAGTLVWRVALRRRFERRERLIFGRR